MEWPCSINTPVSGGDWVASELVFWPQNYIVKTKEHSKQKLGDRQKSLSQANIQLSTVKSFIKNWKKYGSVHICCAHTAGHPQNWATMQEKG